MLIKNLFIVLLFAISVNLVGQVNSAFFASKTQGCSPLTVQFTDQSTGNVTSWNWTFGNGNISTLQNPVAIYTIPGTYTVTLLVSNGAQNSQSSQIITVFANPIANFSATPINGCPPLNVVFQDLSTPGSGAINQWIWNFGDGNSGNIQSPSHTYNLSGNYTVTLQIKDQNNCSADTFISNYIQVKPAPIINFSVNETFSCEPPLNVTFTNNSTGTQPLTYSWDFGDGTTSNLQSPSHLFNNIGNFDISLSVTDVNNCVTDTFINDFINVSNVIASFDFNDTICKGQSFNFTNTSIGGNQFLWNFGDGITSNLSNPSHTYNNSGNYTVTMIATENANCKDTIVETIYVENFIASFSQSTNYWCDTPLVVNFTDTSPGIVNNWSWNFSNGTSNEQNPSNTYNNFGSYPVTLIATNSHGCIDTISGQPIIIAKPTFTITSDTNRTCIPVDINFSMTPNFPEAVTQYNWNFGDGNTSNLSNPTNTFTQAGDYYVSLAIENSEGCTSIDSILIEVGDKLVPIARIDTIVTCAKETVYFYDETLPDTLADEWWWYFGENEGESTQQDATHLYQDTTGTFLIQFVVGYNGCYSDTLKDSLLVLGPIAEINASLECDSPFVYSFDVHIIDGKTYSLNYGDGNIININYSDTSYFETYVHTYDSSYAGQDFYVILSAYNDTVNNPDGCEYLDSVLVQVRDVYADFGISDTLPCTYELVTFNALAPLNSSIDASTYNWAKINSLGTLTQIGTGASITHTFNINGTYSIRLIATDVNGCSDTIVKQITTYKPLVGFTADTLIGCTPFLVNFLDTTIADTTIVNWQWNFGDGTIISVDTNSVSHSFNLIQNNTITLTITDTLGCIGTLTKNFYIVSTRPKPQFTISDLTLCAGDSAKFTNSTVGYGTMTYSWDFGDVGISSLLSPWHTFNDSGKFVVSVYAVDQLGCDSLFTKTDTIHVQAIPIAGFTVDTTIWDCYYNVHPFMFTDTTQSSYLNSWSWSFGNGSVSTLQNPSNVYNEPGFYDVSLIVTTTYGCKDTILKPAYINVKGPTANMNFPSIVCRGQQIDFFVTDTTNVFSFDWEFGDGNYLQNANDTISHIYTISGNRMPTLLLHSDTIGTCDVPMQLPIYIHELYAGFSSGSLTGCLPYNITFTDTSVSIADQVAQWSWDFGNSTSSNIQGPHSKTYSSVGNFDVKLIVRNQFGCIDSVSKTIIVYDLPVITASNDTTICEGETVQLNATGGVNYFWTPNQYFNTLNTIQSPVTEPDSLITYSVIVTDTNNCSNNQNVTITVQHPFPLNLITTYNNNTFNGDTLFVILGDTVFFNVITDSSALYFWTPSTFLNCDKCQNPYSVPIESTEYQIMVLDTNDCKFETLRKIYIKVSEATIDVPSAFTPNGDNNGNDIIYVNGWGIKKLIEFKIFNRWGQLVFESNDLKKGWDGTYNGKLQSIDTYVYIVKAEAFNGLILEKKGFINLLK